MSRGPCLAVERGLPGELLAAGELVRVPFCVPLGAPLGVPLGVPRTGAEQGEEHQLQQPAPGHAQSRV